MVHAPDDLDFDLGRPSGPSTTPPVGMDISAPGGAGMRAEDDWTMGGANATAPPPGGHAAPVKRRSRSRGSFGGESFFPKSGVPRRNDELYARVDAYYRALGADKRIHSILVANNGNAATKFIRSLHMWSQSTFSDARAISVVAMATPEDLQIGAEYIRMADQIVEVPGGTNNNNYANVSLIVRIAEQTGVDAVWPGWGHASEFPELPEALSRCSRDVRFLGPPAGPMAALGDKVGSTILAQAAGVPTIPWSGSSVAISYADCGGTIPRELYRKACVHSAEQAVRVCQEIGYPIMLKASWGGGGKGIRRVGGDAETRAAFQQVQGEVPGSPVFAMKLAPPSRHVEVQLIADRHGNVVSLYSRDCSTQRRHQKIVEEGPVTVAPPRVLREMESAARALARSVGYSGAATLEYLYAIDSGEFYFLELNPRLQVEHPVTEQITGINLPVCQVLIGAGVPLHRIPDIRRFYSRAPEGQDPIDFEKEVPRAPTGHCVACRVTCEDPEDGFKPTCGSITELSFRSTPNVWGYFSVKAGGGIHEFSDSQIGHLFAWGPTRADAIKAMLVALKDIRIRGEICTIVDYVCDMLQHPDWAGDRIHTGWLDARIAARVRPERPPWHLTVVCGAVMRAWSRANAEAGEFFQALERGQLPRVSESASAQAEEFVVDGVSYRTEVTRRGRNLYRVSLLGTHVDAAFKGLGDGGLLVQVDGRSHILHWEEEPTSTRMLIDSRTAFLKTEKDPSTVLAASPGKLVRFIVPDGGAVVAGQPMMEIEVMKMLMNYQAPASGVVHYQVAEGALLAAGDLVARVDLDMSQPLERAEPCREGFPALGAPTVQGTDVHQVLARVLGEARAVMDGFVHDVDGVVDDIEVCLEEPLLPVLQMQDALAAVEARLPSGLVDSTRSILEEFKKDVESFDDGLRPIPPEFPGAEILALIDVAAQTTEDPSQRRALAGNASAMQAVAQAHKDGLRAYARAVVQELLEHFLATEELFQGDEDTLGDALRARFGGDLQAILDASLSHAGLPLKAALTQRLLSTFVVESPDHFRHHLRRLSLLRGAHLKEVAGQAQQLLEDSLHAELRGVVWRVLKAASAGMALVPEHETLGGSAAAAARSTRKSTLADSVLDGLGSLSLSVRPGRRASSTAGNVARPPTSPARKSIGSPVRHEAAMSPDAASMRSAWPEGSGELLDRLIVAPAAVEDALASFLGDPHLRTAAMLTYVRRVYHSHLVTEPALLPPASTGGMLGCAWTFRGMLPLDNGQRHGAVERGVFLVLEALDDMEAVPEVVRQMLGGSMEPLTLHLAVTEDLGGPLNGSVSDSPDGEGAPRPSHATVASSGSESTGSGPTMRNSDGASQAAVQSAVADAVRASLSPLRDACRLGTVAVMAMCGRAVPLSGVFQWDTAESAFLRDDVLSATRAPYCRLLELAKMRGMDATALVSRNMQLLLMASSERPDARGNQLSRVFVRGTVRGVQHRIPWGKAADAYSDAAEGAAEDPLPIQAGPEAAAAGVFACEEALAAAADELQRRSFPVGDRMQPANWAHVFLAVLPPLPTADPRIQQQVASSLRAAATTLMALHGGALRAASVCVVEIRLRSRAPWSGARSHFDDGEGPAWRVVIRMPTGHEVSEEHVEIYREGVGASHEVTYTPVPRGEGAPEGDLAGAPVLQRYQPLDSLTYRRLAARRFKTTYCYDFPMLVENALREVWYERASLGEALPVMPHGRLSHFQEVVLADPKSHFSRADLALAPTTRPPGSNTVGMVAWRATLRTPDAPAGRRAVVVANDITFQSGAFGPMEDAVFRAAVEEALRERCPVLYVAANAGARVGLASEVRNRLRVQWAADADGAVRGPDYLYLTEADYEALEAASPGSVQVTRVERPSGEVRYRLQAVVGAEEGLGVECLSGSGAIASAFSRAWDEGVTFTLVTGRTVGIGAYLARLGRRCIQRADQPIILTGHQALNKLLQRQVYDSNLQLGGPKIMGTNGVSNHVVGDDVRGVITFLKWLSFVPCQAGAAPLPVPTSDPVDRPVGYVPGPLAKVDPRALIMGAPASEGSEDVGGIFDRGSWMESHAGWARTVVTGRARLGGLAVGVIAVESNTVEKRIPADPGLSNSSEQVLQQAGQVWYPDSALKTAGALEEFAREGLPVVILANWRGFSGGQADLFGGVLQSGSLIVDRLRSYPAPVIVYLPPGAELRGGAWVVVDSQINAPRIEMVADPAARGGVLEPEGIVEIKFRDADLVKMMHALDPEIRRLKAEGPGTEAAVRSREKLLRPSYLQAALLFAELHDTPVRMLRKGVLSALVPLRDARRFLHARLMARLSDARLCADLLQAGAAPTLLAARGHLRAAFAAAHGAAAKDKAAAGQALDPPPVDAMVAEDAAFLAWAEAEGARFAADAVRSARVQRALRDIEDALGGDAPRDVLQSIAKLI